MLYSAHSLEFFIICEVPNIRLKEMSMTLIEVLDTAIKIGLGAAITGGTSYLISKHNHDREIKRISFLRRQEALEQITEKAENYFSAWRRYCSALGGIYSGSNPPNPSFTDPQWKVIKERDQTLLDARDSIGNAVARLRLLGATDVADLVNEYGRPVGEFRDRIILQKQTPSHDEFKAVAKLSHEKMKAFYASVSKVYLSVPK